MQKYNLLLGRRAKKVLRGDTFDRCIMEPFVCSGEEAGNNE